MTRQLRQRHRRIWVVLAFLLPIIFITGLRARRSVPVMSGTASGIESLTFHVSPR